MILAIYCAGSFGKEILGLVRQNEIRDQVYEDILFIDDFVKEDYVLSVKRYGYTEFRTRVPVSDVRLIIATGEPVYRQKLYDQIMQDGYLLDTLIARTSYIGLDCTIEEGTIIFPNAYIGNEVQLGKNVIVHANAKVESDCVIRENSFVSLGAFVGGGTKIGKNSFVGPNAAVMDHVTIGDHSIIGMGSVVIRDILSNSKNVGNPAREIDNCCSKIFKTSTVIPE